MILTVVLLILGLALVVFGSDILVDGASAVARKLGISEFVIGLTIVGFGTSCPELVVSINGALNGSADISIGNVVGSNIFNTLLILGITAVLRPIAISSENKRRDIPVLLAVTLLFICFCLKGSIGLIGGIGFLFLFAGYIVFSFKIAGDGLTNGPEFDNDANVVFRNINAKTFAGIGGNLLPAVNGARAVARFENEDTSDQYGIGANYAMILSAKNAGRNYAFVGSGNGILNGCIAGYSFHKYTIAAANMIYEGGLVLDLRKSNQFIVHCEYANSGICLPKLNAVCEALDMSSVSDFCLKITIMSDLGNTNNWVVRGRNNIKSNTGKYPWNTEQLPLLTHEDGSNWDDCEMANGDSLQIMLVYDGSRTQTIGGFTTKYTARIINRHY